MKKFDPKKTEKEIIFWDSVILFLWIILIPSLVALVYLCIKLCYKKNLL